MILNFIIGIFRIQQNQSIFLLLYLNDKKKRFKNFKQI